MKKRLLLLAPLLAACGWIPLPERTQPDFYFINVLESGRTPPGAVAYMDANQLDYVKGLPDLPYRHIRINANLTYQGASKRLHLQIYAAAQKPDCTTIPSGRPNYTDALLCPTSVHAGELLTEVVLTPGQPVPVTLKGSVLDQAARKRVLYLGVSLLDGKTTPSEWIQVSDIRINGRL